MSKIYLLSDKTGKILRAFKKEEDAFRYKKITGYNVSQEDLIEEVDLIEDINKTQFYDYFEYSIKFYSNGEDEFYSSHVVSDEDYEYNEYVFVIEHVIGTELIIAIKRKYGESNKFENCDFSNVLTSLKDIYMNLKEQEHLKIENKRIEQVLTHEFQNRLRDKL